MPHAREIIGNTSLSLRFRLHFSTSNDQICNRQPVALNAPITLVALASGFRPRVVELRKRINEVRNTLKDWRPAREWRCRQTARTSMRPATPRRTTLVRTSVAAGASEADEGCRAAIGRATAARHTPATVLSWGSVPLMGAASTAIRPVRVPEPEQSGCQAPRRMRPNPHW
jgi:hypothetical protein